MSQEPDSKRQKVVETKLNLFDEEDFDEDKFEEESDGCYSVRSDEGDYSNVSGIMRLKGEFDQAEEDIKLPMWLEIVRFLDRDDCITIDKVPELKGYGRRVNAERRTSETLKTIEQCSKRGKKNCDIDPLLQLDTSQAFRSTATDQSSLSEFFYSWCAEGVDFGTVGQFDQFCEFAGVDPAKGIKLPLDVWHSPKYHFLSEDKKVIFSCSRDPREDGFAEYVGVTGERSRVKWLCTWFKDIVSWDQLVEGKREDHDVYVMQFTLN